MQFDARAAKLLQPGAHFTIDGYPGLRLVASATRRAWTYRFKSPTDGRMRQVQIGAWPAMSLATAAAEWERLRAQRDAGVDPAQAKRQVRTAEREATQAAVAKRRAGVYTVRRLCDDYVAGHVRRHRKAKGAAEVARLFDRLLDPIEALPAAQVTRGTAFDLLEGLAGTPVQAGNLRGELAAAWNYALDAGRLPDDTPNWWRQVMRGRLRSKGRKIGGEAVGTAKRSLTTEEIGTLLRWLPNFSRLVQDGLTMYLWTGMRGGEIMAMEAAEISQEPDGWWWTLPKHKTKNARHELAGDVRVPLVGRALEVVQRRLQAYPGGYVFPSPGKSGHVEQSSLSSAVHFHMPYSTTIRERERPRLTVQRWSPHDLRRTVRTQLAAMGCPRDVAEAVLGHMLPGVEGDYNRHSYDDERREWLGKLSTRLEGLAKATAGQG